MAESIADIKNSLSYFQSKLATATAARESNIQQINTLQNQLSDLNSQRQGLSINSPEYKSIMFQMQTAQSKLSAAQINGTQYANDVIQYQNDVSNYSAKAEQAQKDQTAAENTPGDATSTPPQSVPESSNPGETPDTTPDPVTGYPPDTDVSDPTVTAPLITADDADNDYVIDDGSDPYVSNGETTIPVPEEQEDPDPNEYSAETNRLKAQEEAATEAAENAAETSRLKARGDSAALDRARAQKTAQDSANEYAPNDWRVRLQLAPGANYLYKNPTNPGILKPLVDTDGILFPYTPSINVNYVANYDPTDIVHSNYKIYQYKNSAVDSIQITCDFTAQDTYEANYLLAVIHFFKSVTKMFYGQDQNPVNGTPPPLCYLTGIGAFQFDRHPLVINSFNYALPTDVDYIQTGKSATIAGLNQSNRGNQPAPRQGAGISPGGLPPNPSWSNTNQTEITYVPTRMQISISAVPIISRDEISNKFSLEEYATGALLQGSKRGGVGIW